MFTAIGLKTEVLLGFSASDVTVAWSGTLRSVGVVLFALLVQAADVLGWPYKEVGM